MVKKKLVYGLAALLLTGCGLTGLMGCGNKATAEGRTEIEIVSYKKEAVDTFNKIAARFNETHDDIHLTIDSPNEAMTILKTRFIREDYPDIIVIGGDMDYSNFLDAGLFADISDLDVLINSWNLSHKMERMDCHMQQTQQVSFITKTCLNSMDGKRLKPGMNLQHCVNRFRARVYSRYILDLKTHGPVLHRGMLWLLVWRTRSFAVR